VAHRDDDRSQGQRSYGLREKIRDGAASQRGDDVNGRGGPFPPAPDSLRAWRAVPEDSQSSLCRVAHGVSQGLLRDRSNRLRALGNAVVPQVAEVIGGLIVDLENQHRKGKQ
jgi:hypothetical protein